MKKKLVAIVVAAFLLGIGGAYAAGTFSYDPPPESFSYDPPPEQVTVNACIDPAPYTTAAGDTLDIGQRCQDFVRTVDLAPRIVTFDPAPRDVTCPDTVCPPTTPPPPPPPPPADPVIVAAGDIATLGGAQQSTGDLVRSINPTATLTLGDNAYPDGTLSNFNTYYDPAWGSFKPKTHPSTGNHDYHVANAQGYRDYFGVQAPAEYYSYDIGSWHLISLGSWYSSQGVNPVAGGAEETWLKNDLATHSNACTLAYWHEPLFTSGTTHPNDGIPYTAIWQDLYNSGADVVLNGHEHHYERFAPQKPDGTADASFGIREFVAGTGGEGHYNDFGTIKPNTEAHDGTTFGVLKLTLHSGGYDFAFVPAPGQGSFTDSGSGTCHASPPPSPPPATFKFSDEFNGAAGAPPNPAKWRIYGGSSPPRWGVECFVNDTAHISQDGIGNLVLTATYNPGGVPCTNGSGLYESGGMHTANETEACSASEPNCKYKYGKAEARIKIPCQSGTGMWPAWWEAGVAPGKPWPTDGEIDNLEVMSPSPNDAHQTIHGGPSHWQVGFANNVANLCGDYHVIGNDWRNGKIDFTLDGAVVHTMTPAQVPSGGTWPFDDAGELQQLILGLQMGSFGGTINNATLPQKMLVDWVRVTQ